MEEEKQSWEKGNRVWVKGNRVWEKENRVGKRETQLKVASEKQELSATSWNFVLQFLCYKLPEMLEQCQLHMLSKHLLGNANNI